jgi:hypothetical protein
VKPSVAKPSVIAAVLAVAAFTAAGCSSSSSGGNHTGAGPTPTTSVTTTPTSSRHNGGHSSPPISPPVSSATSPAAAPVPKSHSASPQPFTKPVAYPSGLKVAVFDIVQGKDTQTGPGAATGKPTTTFTLHFHNGTAKPVALEQVVINVTYGAKHAVAQRLYDSSKDQDFDAIVKPGGSALARYEFSIPTSQLGHVQLTMTFDSAYSVAVFNGSARAGS